jgi:hypothetical protein
MDPILHLSLPVTDLAAARAFYVDQVGCEAGQAIGDGAIDVWFYGLQLTLQVQPDHVLPDDRQGARHFGVTLDRATFEQLLTRLEALPVRWIDRVATDTTGTLRGKTAAKLADPSGNVIELKTYDDARVALAIPGRDD